MHTMIHLFQYKSVNKYCKNEKKKRDFYFLNEYIMCFGKENR